MSQNKNSPARGVVVIGAGGHAKVAVSVLRLLELPIVGICDPASDGSAASVLGIPVLPSDDQVLEMDAAAIELVNGVGGARSMAARKNVFERFKARGFSFRAVVHPGAIVAADTEIGEGAQIMAGAVVQPACRIGADAIVNTRASIDHDTVLGQHAHIAPGAVICGGVRIGTEAYIGAGATVIPEIKIGARAMVGAGAVVIRNVADGACVVGNPARNK